VALIVPALVGKSVRLEPLTADHVDGLARASAEDRSTYAYTGVPDGLDDTVAFVAALLRDQRAGETIPFAQVRVADSSPVGVTRYLSLRARREGDVPYAVEIGGTWLAASAQGTAINPEAKLLLLTHALDVWRVGRVDLKTDARNSRSRAGIASIGATFEAILRNWQPSLVDGEETKLRDTAMFSIVDDDWPRIRDALATRVEKRL
jgi:RimJ/RimL family protein N-acetyltransferase